MRNYEINIDLQINLSIEQVTDKEINSNELVESLVFPEKKIEWEDISYAVSYIERTSAN